MLATFVVWSQSTFVPLGITPLLANVFSAPAGLKPPRAGTETVQPVMAAFAATEPGATVNTSASKLGLVMACPKDEAMPATSPRTHASTAVSTDRREVIFFFMAGGMIFRSS